MVVYLRKRKQKWNRFCWDVEEMNDDVYFTIGGHYPLIINLSINKLLNSWDPMGIIFQNDEIGSNERRIFANYEVGEGLHLLQSIILFLCH